MSDVEDLITQVARTGRVSERRRAGVCEMLKGPGGEDGACGASACGTHEKTVRVCRPCGTACEEDGFTVEWDDVHFRTLAHDANVRCAFEPTLKCYNHSPICDAVVRALVRAYASGRVDERMATPAPYSDEVQAFLRGIL